MTPSQLSALEALAGRVLTDGEIEQIDGLLPNRRDSAIAAILSLKADGTPRTRIVSRHITERGVRALAVLPRHRKALLDTLAAAATETPAWFIPTLAALGVPEEDRQALADDLASAQRWLLDADGIDVGAAGARQMLDLIAAGVATAAPACAAVKALAEQPDPIPTSAVSYVFNKPEV